MAKRDTEERPTKDSQIEGYSIDEPDVWDSEVFGIVFQVGFVALCVGAVVVFLSLARPVIDNTIAAFPVR